MSPPTHVLKKDPEQVSHAPDMCQSTSLTATVQESGRVSAPTPPCADFELLSQPSSSQHLPRPVSQCYHTAVEEIVL